MKGKKEKKDYDQNIGLHEVFLESVPSALIITVIFITAGMNDRIIFESVSHVDCYQYTTWLLTNVTWPAGGLIYKPKCIIKKKNGIFQDLNFHSN